MNKTLIFLVTLLAIAFSHNVNPETVQVWTEKDFPTQYDQSKPTLLLLYAPWCGHCKALIPTWNKLQAELPEANVAAIDCDSNKSFCGNFADKGRLAYPMLRLLNTDGQVYIFEGKRDKNTLIGFVNATHANARTIPFPAKLKSQLPQKSEL